MKKPVYVGCSMNFAGITTDEEIEGLTVIVHKIMSEFDKIMSSLTSQLAAPVSNGI